MYTPTLSKEEKRRGKEVADEQGHFQHFQEESEELLPALVEARDGNNTTTTKDHDNNTTTSMSTNDESKSEATAEATAAAPPAAPAAPPAAPAAAADAAAAAAAADVATSGGSLRLVGDAGVSSVRNGRNGAPSPLEAGRAQVHF